MTFYFFYKQYTNLTFSIYSINSTIAGMIRACYFLLRSCFLMMSMRFFLVTSVSSGPSLAFCLSLRCCSWRWGELRSWGGMMDPVGLTRFTTSKNSRLLLLLRRVMAVPLCPSRPALPTWMRENKVEKTVRQYLRSLLNYLYIRLLLTTGCIYL